MEKIEREHWSKDDFFKREDLETMHKMTLEHHSPSEIAVKLGLYVDPFLEMLTVNQPAAEMIATAKASIPTQYIKKLHTIAMTAVKDSDSISAIKELLPMLDSGQGEDKEASEAADIEILAKIKLEIGA